MKASEAEFRYPVLGFKFEKPVDYDGRLFRDFDDLTVSNAHELKASAPLDMTLIDSEGRQWKVRSIRKVGRFGPLFLWLLGLPLGWHRTRLDYDLDVLPTVSLADVQRRVSAIFKAFGKVNDYDAEDKAETKRWIAGINAATSIAEVAELTDWGAFQ